MSDLDDFGFETLAIALDRNAMRWFQFVGAKRPGAAWPAGVYRGRGTLQRAGAYPATLERVVELR